MKLPGSDNMEKDYTIAAVVRALEVLKLFDSNHEKMTLTEIAQRSGITKSSVLRVLASCEQSGFIKYDPDTRQYRLGIEIYRLAHTAYDFLGLEGTAMPYMRKAVDETGLVSHLGTVEDDHVLIVSKVWPKNAAENITMFSRIGGIVPVHCTGIGKVMTAFSPPDVQQNLLDSCRFERYTERTICDRGQFAQELERIRARGYALTIGEHEPYIECITFPVYGLSNKLVGAISLTGLSQSLNPQAEQEIIRTVREMSIGISKELGA